MPVFSVRFGRNWRLGGMTVLLLPLTGGNSRQLAASRQRVCRHSPEFPSYVAGVSVRSFPPPRDWLVDPGQFGRSVQVEWKPEPSEAPALVRYRAAKRQHHLARKLREQIDTRRRGRDRLSIAQIAKTVGISDDHIHRALSGARAAELALFEAIANALNLSLKIDLTPLAPPPAESTSHEARPRPKGGGP